MLPLRYMIGKTYDDGETGYITEVGYDAPRLPDVGEGWAYGNLFNEKYAEQNTAERAYFGPYLDTSDTAQEYNEGQIDPNGKGWLRNLDMQINKCVGLGFSVLELDNPDAYLTRDVLRAVDYVANHGLKTFAKNPMLCGDPTAYVAHPAVIACVVEHGAGTVARMDLLRREAGKPLLPVRFIAFGGGLGWAQSKALTISRENFQDMSVSYSAVGEYCSSEPVIALGCPDTAFIRSC
jgi:hypothetical protein